MSTAVYLLALATNLACAFLLLAAYRRVRKALLLWSGLCFAGLAMSSALVFVDLVLLPAVDLYLIRLVVAAGAMGLLMYGLIFGQR